MVGDLYRELAQVELAQRRAQRDGRRLALAAQQEAQRLRSRMDGVRADAGRYMGLVRQHGLMARLALTA